MDVQAKLMDVASRVASMNKRSYTENDFWKMVKVVDWGRRNTGDTTPLRKVILKTTSPLEIEDMKAMFKRLKHQLGKRFNDWLQDHPDKDEQVYGGDGYDDLLAHVIGLGKAEYNASMRNPSKLFDRWDRRDYRESFAYVLPDKRDYENIIEATYADKAEKVWENYYSPLIQVKSLEPELRTIDAALSAMTELRPSASVIPLLERAVDANVALHKKLKDVWNPDLKADLEDSGFQSNFRYYGENIMKDYLQWID